MIPELEQRGLFEPGAHVNEYAPRIACRPLGALSSFVAEQLPVELNSIRGGAGSADGLVRLSESLLGQIPSRQIPYLMSLKMQAGFGGGHYFPHECDVAGLDLKMMESAIVQSGGTAPPELIRLVDDFSKANKQPPVLTYEEIVYINFNSDPRNFTDGEAGKSEHDFYEGHRKIEEDFDDITSGLMSAGEHLQEASTDSAVAVLETSARKLRATLANLDAIGQRMPKEHFAEFRPYFNPARANLKGPSGAFTPGFPMIELLLAGENLPKESHRYIQANLIYFPRFDRRKLMDARDRSKKGLSLTALTKKLGNPGEVVEMLTELGDALFEFRKKHYRAVVNQLPEAITDDVAGSGGEVKPGTFLRERMKIRHIKRGLNGS